MREEQPRFDGEPCRVIGVLDDGAASLAPAALAHLRRADVVVGGSRTLQLLAEHIAPEAQRHDLTGRLAEVPQWVSQAQQAGQRCVVLATGDPLCHGIAAYLASRLCIEALDILPNLSMLQLACARLGLPWHDIKIVSVHSRDAGEWHEGADPGHGLYALLQAAHAHPRLAVYTSPDNTPDRVARLLLAEGLGEHFQCAVAERLCQPAERVRAPLSLVEVAAQRFEDPNLLLLWRLEPPEHPVLFGLADERYEQRHPDKGLITKHEVRAVSLARLQLRRDSVVWDIGAGSGAVGLEAARLCRDGHVYAIEKNADDCAIALRNRRTMGVGNYTLMHGKAPEGLDGWPDPCAVFIGGSGGELAELIALALRRLKLHGTLVMNFVTFENLGTAVEALKREASARPLRWDVVQLQAARSKPILQMHRLAAENPVWIVCASVGDRDE